MEHIFLCGYSRLFKSSSWGPNPVTKLLQKQYIGTLLKQSSSEMQHQVGLYLA